MATTINKTDGTVLSVIEDGAVDTTNTSISLIGRLYRNYGELINENFVKLLENFASSSAPTVPITGQLWYDTVNKALKIYRSTGFVTLATRTVSSTEPSNAVTGDLWYDTTAKQLKIYTGTAWEVVSPDYSFQQGKTGVFPETITDNASQNHICLVHYQANTRVAIECSDTEWTPLNAISGITTVKPGYNLTSTNSQKFIGTATNADSLAGLSASVFVKNNANGNIAGNLSLTGTYRLTLGNVAADPYFSIVPSSSDILINTGTNGTTLSLAINSNVATRINSDLQTLIVNGNVTKPGLSFINDTDTGIYRTGPNALALGAGAHETVVVTDTGVTVNGTLTSSSLSFGDIAVSDITADSVTATDATFSNVTVGNLTATTIGSGAITSTANIVGANLKANTSVISAGNIISTGQTGIGYGTGAGGTVVQSGSKSTSVTLNKICGRITTHNAALAAEAEVSFIVNNSNVTISDIIVLNIVSGGTAGQYMVAVTGVTNGTFTVSITNLTTASLSHSLILNFAVLKSVIS